MYKGKRILAIIPARSGSKGMANKNISLIENKPLIAYTIEVAKESNVFDYIFVSTDSEEYAQISRQYGAEVPFLRPIELAQDTSKAVEFEQHAITALKEIGYEFDYFVRLQPTSPLRTSDDVRNVISILIDAAKDAVVS